MQDPDFRITLQYRLTSVIFNEIKSINLTEVYADNIADTYVFRE